MPKSLVAALLFTLISVNVPMTPRGTLAIVFTGQVAANIDSLVTGAAQVGVIAPQWDALPQNSAAQLVLRNDVLFRSGFQ